LLADPGDLAIGDIREFVALSFAREEREHKEREDALARDEARVAEIKAAQDRTAAAQVRTAHLQRTARWAFAAIGVVILIAAAVIEYLQWDKAQQLATKELQLRNQAFDLRNQVTANQALKNSLSGRQDELDRAQANILAGLSETELLKGEIDSAVRLASRSVRIDLALSSNASLAATALASALANWPFSPILRGHGSPVESAAFSPDGSRIVTASGDDTARIWDAHAKEIAVLHCPTYTFSAAFSPDGSRIVTASGDSMTKNVAQIWDVATAKQIAVLRGHDDVVGSAAFSPDGSRIVTASADSTARIWDAATAKEIAILQIPHTGRGLELRSAAFSPDGSRIVTASEDKTARIWNAATAEEIAVLRGHDNWVLSAAFSPDGSRIVTASADKTARIWDASGKEVAVLRGPNGWVASAAFSPDGSRIVTASYDKTARIWDTATAKEIAILRGHAERVNSAAFSPDGSRIVTASGEVGSRGEDNVARIWDVNLQTMSATDLLAEACVRLAYPTSRNWTREEMRLAGYPDSMPEIDMCQ
jgi:WD40 repeat protein